jgi:hypothetical protein
MSLKQISELVVILSLEVVDRLKDSGEVPGKQFTHTSFDFDFAEKYLGEEESFEGISSAG